MVCPVSGLAFYLWMRFDVVKSDLPPFENRLQWYRTKLMAKESDPFDELSYETHKKACNMAYIAAGAKNLSGTHVARKEGCLMADLMDVPDAQMRRLGRWDYSRMVLHYSSGLPRGGARRIAGHGFEEGISRLIVLVDE
jgi:hypothetical protein